MNNNPILNTAFKAARSAGKIIMKSLDKLDELKIKKKSSIKNQNKK
jgi:fructose-1,6-bisphosphatase/inositol monophosphatase family enzyme